MRRVQKRRTINPAEADKPSVAQERRRSLIRAAYERIASEGFEGLRTRDVADRAGVNIATLHYYFPTKEALIGGVAEYLSSQFITLHAPAVAPSGSPALDRLHQEFADARFYHNQHPDLTAVMLELRLRARRDPAIGRIVDPLLGHWRAGIERWMREGVAEGVLRADLDPGAAATFLVASLSGAASLGFDLDQLESILEQASRWLLSQAGNIGTGTQPKP